MSKRRLLAQNCLLLHAALACLSCSEFRGGKREQAPIVLTVAVPLGNQADPGLGINSIAPALYLEGLTFIESTGRVTPGIAESWEASADGLTWRFRLRDGVVFHDGSPLTSTLVKARLEHAVSSPQDRTSWPGLADIAAIEARSTHDLVIRVKKPSGLLLEALTTSIYKPGPRGTRIGTGPFRPVKSEPDLIELEVHPQYQPRPPAVDRFVLRTFPSHRLAWASLLRGEVDFVSEVVDDARDLVRNDSVEVLAYQRPFVYGLVFNLERDLLRSRSLRLALNLAIDREQVIERGLRGRGVVATAPLTPLHWSYDHSVRPYALDQHRAIELLENAGHVLREGGKDEPPARLRFTCTVPRNYAVLERLAMILQEQLFQIGVDMRIQAVDNANAQLLRRDFDAMLLDIIGGYGLSMPYSLWHSTSRDSPSWNVFGYRNAMVDAALDAWRYSRDEAVIRRATAAFQRAIMDDPPAVFLAWNERARALSRRFEIPPTYRGDVILGLPLIRPRNLNARQVTN